MGSYRAELKESGSRFLRECPHLKIEIWGTRLRWGWCSAPKNKRRDPRPAFWLEDVHRADFLAIIAPGQKNFSLRNVSAFRLVWSRAGKDTNLETVENQML